MTLHAQVNAPFVAEAVGRFAGDLPTGLVGSITVGVYDAPLPGGSVIVAPTTTGIIELAGPTYQASLTVPTSVPAGVVRWVIPPQGLQPQQIAEEDLIVSPIPDPTQAGYIEATDTGAGDGVTRDSYEPDNLITLTATVYGHGGTLEDPDTLSLRVLDPTGQTTTYALGDMTRQSLGIYTIDILAQTPRTWVYRFATTEPYADTGDHELNVLPSALP